MPDLKVEAYAGYKANQRPLRFTLGDRMLHVIRIDDQWYGPNHVHFRVIADDGNVYVLRYDESSDRWSLEAFRAVPR